MMNITTLKVLYQNVNGLRTKPHFRQRILDNDFNEIDIIALTETWLYSGISNSRLCDSTYDVFRLDRNQALTGASRGGGVMLMVRSDLGAYILSNDEVMPPTEMLWVTIPTKLARGAEGTNLHIGVAYAPPNHTLPTHINNVIRSVSHVYKKHPNDNFLVMGDFNLSNIQWNDELEPSFKKKRSIKNSKRLLEQFNFLGLKQQNCLRNDSGNTLDLVFSDLPLTCFRSALPMVREDRRHPTVEIHLTVPYPPHTLTTPYK